MENLGANPETRLGEQLEIDFLILADKAEAINGKLYMMGGAWDRLAVIDFAQPIPFSLAVGILVPWNLTNQEHPVRIWVEHEDGTVVVPEIRASVNMGRPPVAVPGQALRALMIINVNPKLPKPGTYCVKGVVGDQPPKRVVLHATQAQRVRMEPA